MSIERIGPYAILRKLGSGGMGTVYLARKDDADEEVALKVLSPSLARESGFVERFVREVESLRKLINPHVVQLLESGTDDETYYYAMEYVEGETLTARLRRDKRMPWKETAEVAIQICSALKSAHDAGIIHRDLKPSNLMLTPDGDVKLTDFGVAQIFASDKLTQTGGIIGTAEYMSPEQAQGKRVTKKSDLYSLGAVMYAMITGRPPFVGKSTLEVIQKHKFGRYDKPSRYVDGLPFWFEDVIVKLLEKDPDKRFPDAYVLSKKLQEVVAKIETTSQDKTLAADNADTERDTPDVTVETGATAARKEPEIGGTFARDLVRAEVESAAQPSPLGQLLNNTWVLLVLLALLVGGGIAWVKYKPLSNDDGPDLNGVAAILKSAERKIKGATAHGPGPAPRLLAQAELEIREGSVELAQETLSALAVVIEKDDKHKLLRKKITEIQDLLAQIDADQEPPPAWQTLREKAEELAEAGELDKARAVWSTIVRSYGSVPSAQTAVDHAREQLQTHLTQDAD